MRKIVAGLFMSLDGVMEAPETWTGPYMSDEVGQAIGSQMATSDTLLLGRVTYQTFAAAFSGGSDPMASQMNSMPKLVVSTTLTGADWQNSTLIKANVVEELARLKQQSGRNIGITGSATLVRSLLRDGLLDELNLLIPPVIVGRGRRLFEEGGDHLRLKLVSTHAFSNGVFSVAYALPYE